MAFMLHSKFVNWRIRFLMSWTVYKSQLVALQKNREKIGSQIKYRVKIDLAGTGDEPRLFSRGCSPTSWKSWLHQYIRRPTQGFCSWFETSHPVWGETKETSESHHPRTTKVRKMLDNLAWQQSEWLTTTIVYLLILSCRDMFI